MPPERLKPSSGAVAWMPCSRVQTSQRPALYSMPLQAACPRHACLHSSAQLRCISLIHFPHFTSLSCERRAPRIPLRPRCNVPGCCPSGCRRGRPARGPRRPRTPTWAVSAWRCERPGGCRHTEPAEKVVARMSLLQSSQRVFKYPRPGGSKGLKNYRSAPLHVTLLLQLSLHSAKEDAVMTSMCSLSPSQARSRLASTGMKSGGCRA